ncbi:hypothetical protein HYH03_010787 [Edaphochlamys debaryana]|uniref:Peptidase M14 domain-containing protein n=1 Tax=Edaphochlamys debaryana TaxID=47281 RepID=A0A836BX70_9CHLO|nr:hypothetical protein HYH03_010787 [Edaphochlamys debaryana]|eukprot:KAG2490869.1 hypothetical protein HYH03_010787 [Edaphochlamys debaryana]
MARRSLAVIALAVLAACCSAAPPAPAAQPQPQQAPQPRAPRPDAALPAPRRPSALAGQPSGGGGAAGGGPTLASFLPLSADDGSPFGACSDWACYSSHEAMEARLEALAAGSGGACRLEWLSPNSVEGRRMPQLVVAAGGEGGSPAAPNPTDRLPKPTFTWIGNMHGDETANRELLLHLADGLCGGGLASGAEKGATDGADAGRWAALLQSTVIRIIPTMNPDGFVYRTRYNAHGKDLNRNFWTGDFPYPKPSPVDALRRDPQGRYAHPAAAAWAMVGDTPALEPEAAAVAAELRAHLPDLSANLHGGSLVANFPLDSCDSLGNDTDCPTGQEPLPPLLAASYAAASPSMAASRTPPFRAGTVRGAAWYPVLGSLQDWTYHALQRLMLTLELHPVKDPPAAALPALWNTNVRSMLRLMELTHMGLRAVVADTTTRAPLSATVDVVSPRGQRSLCADVGRGGYVFLPMAPGLEYSLVVRPYDLSAKGVSYDPVNVTVGLPPGVGSGCGADEGVCGEGLQGLSVERLPVLLSYCPCIKSVTMPAGEHTMGCVAATCGIAAAASLGMANLVFSKMDETAVGDTPALEPEAAAVAAELRAHLPDLSANLHGGSLVANFPLDSCDSLGNDTDCPTGQEPLPPLLAASYAAASPSMAASRTPPFRAGTVRGAAWYPVLGSLQDWTYHALQRLMLTLELHPVKDPPAAALPALWNTNVRSMLRLMELTHMGLRAVVADTTTRAPLSATVDVVSPRGQRSLCADVGRGGYVFLPMAPGLEYSLVVRPYDLSAKGVSYDPVNVTVGLPPGVGSGCGADEGVCGEGLQGLSVERLPVLLSYCPCIKSVTMPAGEHTMGCVAATCGIAAAASLGMANLVFSKMDETAVGDTPALEPEAAAVAAELRAHLPDLSANLHGGSLVANFPLDSCDSLGNDTDCPTGQEPLPPLLAASYAAASPSMAASRTPPFRAGTVRGAAWYPVLGSLQDWTYHALQRLMLTLELHPVKDPPAAALPALWNTNVRSMLRLMELTHMGLRAVVADTTTRAPLSATVDVVSPRGQRSLCADVGRGGYVFLPMAPGLEYSLVVRPYDLSAKGVSYDPVNVTVGLPPGVGSGCGADEGVCGEGLQGLSVERLPVLLSYCPCIKSVTMPAGEHTMGCVAATCGIAAAASLGMANLVFSKMDETAVGDTPALEPEAAAVAAELRAHLPDLSANLHGGSLVANFPLDSCDSLGNDTDCPTGQEPLPPLLAASYAAASPSMAASRTPPFRAGTVRGAAWYPVLGSLQDWTYHALQRLMLTLELHPVKDPPAAALPALWNTNVRSMLRLMELTHMGLRAVVADTTTRAPLSATVDVVSPRGQRSLCADVGRGGYVFLPMAPGLEYSLVVRPYDLSAKGVSYDPVNVTVGLPPGVGSGCGADEGVCGEGLQGLSVERLPVLLSYCPCIKSVTMPAGEHTMGCVAATCGIAAAASLGMANLVFSKMDETAVGDTPALEPEAAAVAAELRAHLPDLSANLHGGSLVANFPLDSCDSLGNDTDCPTGQEPLPPLLAASYAAASPSMAASRTPPFRAGTVRGAAWYPVLGSLQDWTYHALQRLMLTLELHPVKDPPAAALPALWNTNVRSMLRLMELTHMGLRAVVADTTTRAPLSATVDVVSPRGQRSLCADVGRGGYVFLPMAPGLEYSLVVRPYDLSAKGVSYDPVNVTVGLPPGVGSGCGADEGVCGEGLQGLSVERLPVLLSYCPCIKSVTMPAGEHTMGCVAATCGIAAAASLGMANLVFSKMDETAVGDTPALEPEAAAVAAELRAHLPDLSANLHGGSLVANFPLDSCDSLGNDTDCPTGQEPLPPLLAASYAAASPSMAASRTPPFRAGTVRGAAWYPVLGSLQDWTYHALQRLMLTLELHAVKDPPAAALPALWNTNVRSMLRLMELTHMGLRAVVTDTTTRAPLSATVDVVSPRGQRSLCADVGRGGYVFLPMAPGLQYSLVVRPYDPSAKGVSYDPVNVTVGLPPGVGSGCGADEGVCGEGLQGLSVERLPVLLSYCPCIKLVTMPAGEHTMGCVAATCGIAAAASLGMANLVFSKMDETAVAADMKKVLTATFPIHVGYIGVGTVAAVAQAVKSSNAKGLWLASAALVGSVLPYTYFLVMDDVKAVYAAGADKKAPPAGKMASLVKSGYIRVALLTAGTTLMVVGLAKTHKK